MYFFWGGGLQGSRQTFKEPSFLRTTTMGLTQSFSFVTFFIMLSFAIFKSSFLSLSSNDEGILREAALTGIAFSCRTILCLPGKQPTPVKTSLYSSRICNYLDGLEILLGELG